MSDCEWRLNPVDQTAVEGLRKTLLISEILASVLAGRGIDTPEQARLFLYGGINDLHRPTDIKGIEEAARLLDQAIRSGDRIAVYGDYDVDGVCSTVILMECLQTLGADCICYIPDRFDEGYGLNGDAIQRLAGQGVRLLVTVDCGINSVHEVELAGQLGIQAVITDHHTPEKQLPAAQVIVNPKLEAPERCRHLCGAGVVFKLVQHIGAGRLPPALISSWLELVALATVADIVPLQGENRILVKEGLLALKKSTRPGMKALIRESRINEPDLSSWHLGFVLAPRVNAAGRLANASLAISLMMADQPQPAQEMARELCRLNEERKRIEQRVFEEAACCVEQWKDSDRQGVLVIDGENWHHGVLGIAASRLVERYQLPVVLVSWEGSAGRGSARSVPGFNLYEALHACRDQLERFGGHAMAAGLELHREQVEPFREQIREQTIRLGTIPQVVRHYDGTLRADEIKEDLIRELKQLEPWGEGNPAPRFLISPASLERGALMGAPREHYRAVLQPGQLNLVGFRKPDWIHLPADVFWFEVVGELELDTYHEHRRIQIKAHDIWPLYRKKASCQEPSLIPVVDEMAARLQARQSVLCVFPTYRVWQRYCEMLAGWFLPSNIVFGHGHLSWPQRRDTVQKLAARRPGLYLLTQAFWQYLARREGLPSHPGLVVHFGEPGAGEWAADTQQINYSPWPGDLNVERTQYLTGNDLPTLLYIHHRQTWQSLLEKNQGTVNSPGLAFTDGIKLCSNRLPRVDRVVFADPPFSFYEARAIASALTVAGHVRTSVQACFHPDSLSDNEQYLQQIYPHREVIGKTAAWLRRHHQGGMVSGPLELLAENLAGEQQVVPDIRQLRASLQVLADLGLCRLRKKGSIIEINMLNPDSPTIDLADSPYYLEGLAEKKAWGELKHWINQQYVW